MSTLTEDWWRQHGYLAGRQIGEDLWLCVAPMLFTFRVMLCSEGYVHSFFCYEDLGLALAAFELWDGVGSNPIEGWTKHHAH